MNYDATSKSVQDSKYWKLDEHGEPVPSTLMDWADTMQKGEVETRQVGRTQLGPYLISTVFLGLDHAFFPDSEPLIWETMVFGGDTSSNLECERCGGPRANALAMHERMVAKIADWILKGRQ